MKNCAVAVLLASALSLADATPGYTQSPGAKGHSVVVNSSIARAGDEGKRVHTNVRAFAPLEVPVPLVRAASARTAAGQPPFAGLFNETPASLACVYQLVSPVKGCNPTQPLANASGGSRAIAVVDAYDDPHAASDLAAFSTQFGLPPADFHVVYATGVQPPPSPPDPGTNALGWELEESLDVQMAHAMAPGAKIYLVEASSSLIQDLLLAVQVASNLVAAAGGGEISMSWGTGDRDGENLVDSYFTTPGVVYFAAAGDGSGPIYPSTSPNVVAVGGTAVRRNPATGDFLGQIAWEDTGGGLTFNELTPSYQSGLGTLLAGGRGVPDVAAVADPDTGVWVYDTGNTGLCIPQSAWCILGGTSAATPIMAGIANAAGHFASSSSAELTTIYRSGVSANFSDVTGGFCGYYMQDSATKGWDFCTGVGTPVGLDGK